MDAVALIAGLVGYLVFGFILTIALARLALAIADLADRIDRGKGEEPPPGED